MRAAINLLSDSPYEPTGAIQFWNCLIPDMDRQLHLAKSLMSHQDHDQLAENLGAADGHRRTQTQASDHLILSE